MRAEHVGLAALENEQHPLLAWFEMLDLPDQFLDLTLGSLGIEAGRTRVIELDLQGFQVDHGSLQKPRQF